GAEPLEQPPLAPELLGLTQHVAAYERLALQAALSRDPVDVKKALLAHPLIGQYAIAEQLLERMAAEVLAWSSRATGATRRRTSRPSSPTARSSHTRVARSAPRTTSGSRAASTCCRGSSTRPASTGAAQTSRRS